MAELVVEDERDRSLRLITIRGSLTEQEFREQALQNFDGDEPPLKVMWDFTESDLTEISPEAFQELFQRGQKVAAARAGGKTAVITGGNLEYGISRMVELMVEAWEIPIALKSFRTRAEAESWLFD